LHFAGVGARGNIRLGADDRGLSIRFLDIGEDEIQRALRRIQAGRTTFLITHRLSQIRWADLILVLDQGKLVASGNHERLLRSSFHYRRIFARYDITLPPLADEAAG